MQHKAPRSRRIQGSLLVGVLVLCACDKGKDSGAGTGASSSTATASAQSADAQLAEIGEYRLTMESVGKYFAAQRNITLKAGKLSPAEREAMKARTESRYNANASVDDVVRNVESEPMIKDAVRDAGLSPREFALVGMTFMQTSMAAGIAKMRPDDNQDSLIRAMKANPENVKFLFDNEAELNRKQKAVEEDMKRLQATEKGS